MTTYRFVFCQLEAVRHCRRSVKKIVGLVTPNSDSDSIFEKNHSFDLDLKNHYNTNYIIPEQF